jgi:hypothetical protein
MSGQWTITAPASVKLTTPRSTRMATLLEPHADAVATPSGRTATMVVPFPAASVATP